MRLLAPLLLLASLALAASAQAATVAIPGSPFTIYVNDAGNVTGRLAGDSENVFFPPADNDSPNAGFTLGFPDAVGTIAAGSNFGPISTSFSPVSQSGLTGAGTAASPYQVTTVYTASDGSTTAAEVTQVVTYVNGETRFAVSYSVRNPSPAVALRFRAGVYADLYLAGSDVGTGILAPGPPRLVGGLNAAGRFGVFQEVAGNPWSRFEEDDFSTVSSNLANLAGAGLDNTVNPSVVDNGAAVQWDDRFTSGLAALSTATFNSAYATAVARPTPPVDNSIDAQLARLPAPKLGQAVNVAPVSGDVFVKLPAGSAARAAQSKGRGFVPLLQAKQIAVGSLLDTTQGKVRLVSAANASGKRQQGDFDGAFFKTIQSRSGKGLTELRLTKGKFSGCRVRAGRSKQAGAARRRYRRRTVRRLTGSATGRFRTRGRYASATVRGTKWTVTDRCDGTLTRVKSGVVVVRDLRRHKNLVVRAGKSRLVRAPG